MEDTMIIKDVLIEEHQRIKQVIDELKLEIQNQQRSNIPNTGILLMSIDFLQTYAHKTHQVKEENMLFASLQNKTVSEIHKNTIKTLTQQHRQLRFLVNEIQELTDTYRKGDESILQQLTNTLQKLTLEYTNHFKKENEQFFSAIINEYFTKEERQQIIEEFNVFDRTRIHEKYDQVIDQIKKM